LRRDLADQIKTVIGRWAPQRILIEPSGVADLTALLHAVEQSDIQPLVRARRVFVVIDAGAFLRDYARMPEYFEAQAALTPVLIFNKTDLVTPATLAMIENTLRTLNPRAVVVPTVHGLAEPGVLESQCSRARTSPASRGDSAAAPR
jgi:G3E family GTPase